jgi:hypothetical protein
VTTGIDREGTYQGVPVHVFQPTEQLSGFSPLSLLSWNARRTRRLITAGYADAKREMQRLRRRRARGAGADVTLPGVDPAFRHEVA